MCFPHLSHSNVLGTTVREQHLLHGISSHLPAWEQHQGMALQGAATKACACNWDLAVYPDRFFIFLAVNPGLVGSSSEGMES